MNLLSFLKKNFSRQDHPSTRETIEELVTEHEEGEDSLHDEERHLFRNILKLRTMTAEDLMVPRADIWSIARDTPLEQLGALLRSSSHTRWPVSGDTLDDIQGFLHVRDISELAYGAEKKDIAQVIQPILFVPVSMPVIHLLSKMRESRTSIAIVVDEYGGTDGLVTAWDILNEILGEMLGPQEVQPQEHGKMIEHEAGAVVVDARVPVQDLERYLGMTLGTPEAAEEADTIGGLIMYYAGRVPDRCEVIRSEDGIQFEIIDATPRSIIKVKIYLPQELRDGAAQDLETSPEA